MRESLRARASRLALVVGCALGLAACSHGDPGPLTAQQLLDDVVDTFSDDNTGAYTLTYTLDGVTRTDAGYYRVAPDANGTLHTVSGPDGEVSARFLRTVADTYLLVPRSAVADVRNSCWVRGDLAESAPVSGVEDAAIADVPDLSPAVEVVLSLRDPQLPGEGDADADAVAAVAGGAEDDGPTLVAQGNLRTVVSALGSGTVRRLALTRARRDVPVALTVEAGRITGWRVALSDIAEAAPQGEELGEYDDDAAIEVTFAEPRVDVDFSPPATDRTISAKRSETRIAEFIDECIATPPGTGDESATKEPTTDATDDAEDPDDPTADSTDDATDDATDDGEPGSSPTYSSTSTSRDTGDGTD